MPCKQLTSICFESRHGEGGGESVGAISSVHREVSVLRNIAAPSRSVVHSHLSMLLPLCAVLQVNDCKMPYHQGNADYSFGMPFKLTLLCLPLQ